mmetsp:Transcript_74959/g.211794  ORF Transcript_74959/g.211794 Transcript_74959/m.211794 type:complete len:305 (-) Transcript_74959:66-980(-)
MGTDQAMSLTKRSKGQRATSSKLPPGLAEVNENGQRKRSRDSKPAKANVIGNGQEELVDTCAVSSSSGAAPAAPSRQATEGRRTISDEEENLHDGDDMFTGFPVGEGGDDSVLEWRQGLKDLRRACRPQPQTGQGNSPKPTPDELLGGIRHAIQNDDWTNLVAPAVAPRPTDVVTTIQQLHTQELVAVLRNCVQRYETNPRERDACATWISNVLKYSGTTLMQRPEVQEAFKPLLGMGEAVGQVHEGEVLSQGLGKWRFVAELATRWRDGLQSIGKQGPGDDEEAETHGDMAVDGASDSGGSEE